MTNCVRREDLGGRIFSQTIQLQIAAVTWRIESKGDSAFCQITLMLALILLYVYLACGRIRNRHQSSLMKLLTGNRTWLHMSSVCYRTVDVIIHKILVDFLVQVHTEHLGR